MKHEVVQQTKIRAVLGVREWISQHHLPTKTISAKNQLDIRGSRQMMRMAEVGA